MNSHYNPLKNSVSYKSGLYDHYLTHVMAYQREFTVDAFDRACVMFEKYFSRFLPASKEARILDLGCGAGEFLYYLHKKGYKNTIGVDISSEMVEVAKSLGVHNVEIADATVYLKAHHSTFDLITAHDLIEHLGKTDILTLVTEMHRALVNGGTVLISTLNVASPFGMAVFGDDFTHQVALTPKSLAQVLRMAGFREVQVYPKRPYVHNIKSAIRCMLWKIIEQVIRAYLLVETGNIGSGVYTQTMFAIARKIESR